MPEVECYSKEGEPTGTKVNLADSVFARPVDKEAVYQAIVAYQINQHLGTAKTKTRAEVRGGGAKPWRQKGLGRARQGSIRAPQWKGGGVVFGPRGIRKRRKLPKRLKRNALCSALSARLAEQRLVVIEPFEMAQPKTKEFRAMLQALDLDGKKVLFVQGKHDPIIYKSARNLPGVEVRVAPAFSVYDILNCHTVVLTRDAVEKIEEVWAQ